LAADVKAKAGPSDMVQQTFLCADRGFDRFLGRSESEMQAWLRQILLNVVNNFHRDFRETGKRKVGREEQLAPQDTGLQKGLHSPDRTPSSICRRGEAEDELRRVVERLPSDYRQIIMLRYWSRLSFAEIGEIMHRTPDAARKLWARALERLESDLGTNDNEFE
jgi:RNA polymerase sigma-70 factor (ECF subfamily)